MLWCLLILINILLLAIEGPIRCIIDAPTLSVVLLELFFDDFLKVSFHPFLSEEIILLSWQVTVLQGLLKHWIGVLVRVRHCILGLDLRLKQEM